MAPTPTISSPGKGKARTYLCGPCGCRHAAPTGRNCRQQRQKKAQAAVIDNRRSPLKSGGKPKRKVGCPRKLPTLPQPDIDDSQSESIESVLRPLQRASADRPVPAPRTRVPTGTTRHAVVASPSGPANDTVSANIRGHITEDSTDVRNATRPVGSGQSDTQLILDQIAQLCADNSAEIRRVELEARQERLREQENHKAEKEFLTSTILSIQHSIASLRTPAAPRAPTSAPCHQLPPMTVTHRLPFSLRCRLSPPWRLPWSALLSSQRLRPRSPRPSQANQRLRPLSPCHFRASQLPWT